MAEQPKSEEPNPYESPQAVSQSEPKRTLSPGMIALGSILSMASFFIAFCTVCGSSMGVGALIGGGLGHGLFGYQIGELTGFILGIWAALHIRKRFWQWWNPE